MLHSYVQADSWTVAGRTFTSRLIVGTGKYKSLEENAAAVEASGAEIVTVAVRRVNISDPNQPRLTDFIDPNKVMYLPNTAGCFTAEEAIRTLRLAREAGGWNLVKLEVLGEAKTLYPDMRETLRATETLVKEGFEPMVYCVDDPIAAKQLEEAGAVAIMPLGAPIGSGLGIQNRVTIRLIVEGANVPVLVDAGVGTASDAAVAMELGCDGVLMNTAIAEAKDPVLMARAMKAAVEAGRLAYLAGRMQKRRYADPSSPLGGAHLGNATWCPGVFGAWQNMTSPPNARRWSSGSLSAAGSPSRTSSTPSAPSRVRRSSARPGRISPTLTIRCRSGPGRPSRSRTLSRS